MYDGWAETFAHARRHDRGGKTGFFGTKKEFQDRRRENLADIAASPTKFHTSKQARNGEIVR